jgi:dimethylargininase
VRVHDYDCAIVRAIPQGYAPAYAGRGIQIDGRAAHGQHQAYTSALRSAGVTVNELAADQAFYDCVFVEDTAIIWRDRALVTRMAEHREGEQRGVCDALRGSHALTTLSPGSRLEGGDVLHTEEGTYVGLTSRTNPRGVDELREFLGVFGRRVTAVPVANALHLKSAATYLGNGTLLAAPGHIDSARFDVQAVIETAPGEQAAANCVRVRDTLLVRTGFPATLDRLRRFARAHGVTIALLDLSEFEKGGGSATCLSLLWHVPQPRP